MWQLSLINSKKFVSLAQMAASPAPPAMHAPNVDQNSTSTQHLPSATKYVEMESDSRWIATMVIILMVTGALQIASWRQGTAA